MILCLSSSRVANVSRRFEMDASCKSLKFSTALSWLVAQSDSACGVFGALG